MAGVVAACGRSPARRCDADFGRGQEATTGRIRKDIRRGGATPPAAERRAQRPRDFCHRLLGEVCVTAHSAGFITNGPYRARTCDLLLVREALWPTELTARIRGIKRKPMGGKREGRPAHTDVRIPFKTPDLSSAPGSPGEETGGVQGNCRLQRSNITGHNGTTPTQPSPGIPEEGNIGAQPARLLTLTGRL